MANKSVRILPAGTKPPLIRAANIVTSANPTFPTWAQVTQDDRTFETVQDSGGSYAGLKTVEVPGYTPSGGYVAKAVHFDGNASTTNLRQVSSTVPDNSMLSLSGWAKVSDLTNGAIPFLNIGSGQTIGGWISFNFSSTDISMIGSDSAFISFFYGGSDVGPFTAGSWHHFFGAMSTNFSAGSKLIQTWVDGINVLNPVNTDDECAAFLLGIFGKLIAIPDVADNSPAMDLCDIQVWIGQYIDASINIGKFISGGKPVNPSVATAAFGQQTFLFSGDATGFPINQGTGGSFTLTGSLTNASSSPSD